MGLKRPTPIQTLTIPDIKKGENVVARAKTGSGKTAAFGLPIIDLLSEDPYGIFACILTPTRELAFQINEQMCAFGAAMSVRVCVVIGGTDIITEATELEKAPHIVVATPGRMAAHIRDGAKLNVKYLRFIVFDEADRLFDASFESALGTILDVMPNPKTRQTLFFSATLTKAIHSKAEALCASKAKYFEVEGMSQAQTVAELKQGYVFIPQTLKETYLVQILRMNEDKSILIFCSTCKGCEIIAQLLVEMEIENESLHSRKNQARRLASLAKFRGGQSKILVATDVASRGLDIPQVSLVVNFDVPRVPQDYVQRVGRTARAGRGGMAITLVSQYDINIFLEIEKHINIKVDKFEVPENQAMEQLKKVTAAKKMARLRLEDFDLKDESSKFRRRQKRKKNEQVEEKSNSTKVRKSESKEKDKSRRKVKQKKRQKLKK
eukprot:CAMPEP_0167759500 /NCGR_PEP_ID=MMETSP0110_2-20121227/11061_1 /TAXON_ID=629695 /ORGANISM="Gymnochlora sp., Strain CCMP2014" /LENGTH=436 /DNA_ID=CAMNT_0007645899 /DNA_START=451 /DNA_END=1761 /DNA_ORIENTATION=-